MSESPLFRLRDPNPQIREHTLMELVFDPDLSYLSVFNSLVTDRDRDVRRTLMLALGALNHPDTLDALLQGLLDEDNDVVIAAEHALSKLDHIAQKALWQWSEAEDWTRRRAALQALKHFSVRLSQVTPLLSDDIWEVRYHCYLLLGTLQAEADAVLPILREALQQEEHLQARDGVVYALGSLQSPAACELLLEQFFSTQDVAYAEVLAQVIEGYGEQAHGAVLRWGIWASYPAIRALSAALLSQTQCVELPQVIPPLLLDPSLEVRETAAYALYQATASPFWELLAGLYRALSHEQLDIFQSALADLLALPEPVLEEKTRYLLAVYDVASGEASFRHQLITHLKQAEAFSAAQVFIECLLQSPAEEDVPYLIDVLGSWKVRDAYAAVRSYFSDDEHRLAVAQALCSIAPEEKVWQCFVEQAELEGVALFSFFDLLATVKEAGSFVVSEALSSTSLLRRQAALQAVLKYARRDSTFDLAAFLVQYLGLHPQPEDETLDVLIQMSEALSVLPRACFEVIQKWLTSPSESQRRGALYALKPHAAVYQDALQSGLTHELWFVRLVTLELLASLQTPALTQAIRKALTDRDRDVRVLAVSLLGQMRGPERLDWLVDALENGYREIRAVAARGLASFSAHRTVTEPLMVALMEDEAAEVRQAALETLAHLSFSDFSEVLSEALAYEEDISVWLSAIRCLATQDAAEALAWAKRLLAAHSSLEVIQELLPLFEQYLWSTEPLQHALDELEKRALAESTEIDALKLALLPLLCRTSPELAKQSLYHENTQVVAAVILHLPAALVIAEKIWQKALWRKNHLDIRRAIYVRWAGIDALWADFSELARQETDLSLRQIVIEQLGQMDIQQALPLCESLFLKHTEQTQSPLIWSLATYLQHAELETEVLQGLFRVISRSQNTVREQVFAMLMRVQGKQAYRLLQLCLETWDQELVFSAIRILPAWGQPALSALLQLWPDAQLATQIEVLKALGRFEQELIQQSFVSLQTPLAQALTVDELRPFALEVLAHWPDEARSFLLQTLMGLTLISQRTLRYDLYAGLARLYPEESLWAIFQAANSQLASVRTRALIRLNLWLQQTENSENLDLHTLLTYFSEDEAYTVRLRYYELAFANEAPWRRRLIRALRYDVPPVQQMCAYRMGDYFEPEVQEELLQFWTDAKYAFRETLLTVFAYHGMPGLSLDALTDYSSTVRKSAICVVGQHRLQAAEAHLVQYLSQDTSDEVKEACCWALGFMNSPQAYEALCDVVISSHFALQYQALRALRYHLQAASFLLTHLARLQEDRELLVVALESLSHLAHSLPVDTSPAPLIAVIELTYDSELRKLGAQVLQQMTSSEALRYLQQRQLV